MVLFRGNLVMGRGLQFVDLTCALSAFFAGAENARADPWRAGSRRFGANTRGSRGHRIERWIRRAPLIVTERAGSGSRRSGHGWWRPGPERQHLDHDRRRPRQGSYGVRIEVPRPRLGHQAGWRFDGAYGRNYAFDNWYGSPRRQICLPSNVSVRPRCRDYTVDRLVVRPGPRRPPCRRSGFGFRPWNIPKRGHTWRLGPGPRFRGLRNDFGHGHRGGGLRQRGRL